MKSAGSCVVDKLGEIGYQAIRGALRYNPSNAVDINVTGEYIHDKHSAAGEVLAATSLIDNPNTNIGTNPPQYAGGFPGVPYDNRFICGKFCNFSSYSSPAINYIGLLTPGGLAGPGQPLQATQNNNESVYDAYNLAANAHFALNDMFSIDNILAYQHWETGFGVDDDSVADPAVRRLQQPEALELERRAAAEREAGLEHQCGARRLLLQAGNRLLLVPGLALHQRGAGPGPVPAAVHPA